MLLLLPLLLVEIGRRSAPSFVSSRVAGNVSSEAASMAVVGSAERWGSLACV